jgi:hypothetical protein
MAGHTKHDEHHQKVLTKFARHDTNRNKQELRTNKNITPPPTRFPHRSKTAPFCNPPPPKCSMCAHFFFSHRYPQPILTKTGEHLTICILRLFPARKVRASRFSMVPPWWHTPYHRAHTVSIHTVPPPFTARKLGYKQFSTTIRQHARMTRDEAVPTDHGWAHKHENWANGGVFRNHAPFVLNGFLTQTSLKKTLLLATSGE